MTKLNKAKRDEAIAFLKFHEMCVGRNHTEDFLNEDIYRRFIKRFKSKKSTKKGKK